MPNSPDFCPWCGKILPEEMHCEHQCPLTPRKITWMDRFWFWQAGTGMVIVSIIGYYIGLYFGGQIGATVGLFVPYTALALVLYR